jgi:hypothetical protein
VSWPQPWGGFPLDRAKFCHHLVVYCDLDARARVSLDSADKCRQVLARFANREFHHDLQGEYSKMYSHVQDMSTSRVRSLASICEAV